MNAHAEHWAYPINSQGHTKGQPVSAVQLRHGAFVAPFHDSNENPTLCFQRDLELMTLLDKLGFDEAWVGEHHSAGWETIDSPEMFIAAAAERTKRIRFGTGVVSLPYHNPLMVASRIIQLDHMTMGRVMFGAGPGLLSSDALMMGIEPGVTRDRMAEALDVILRLFRGEVVTETTDWYALHEARTHLRPYTQPHPEVSVASAFTPSGGRLAGRYGLGMLCVAATDPLGFDALGTNWNIASEIAAEDGRTMDRSRLRLVVPMHIAETREQAKANIRWGLDQYIVYMNNNLPRILVPDGEDAAQFVIDSNLAVVGTPEDAIAQIDRLLDRQGEFGCILIMSNNWADWEHTKRSYELYARYVIPHFSKANTSRAASYQWVTDHQAEVVEKRTTAARAMFDKHEAEQRPHDGDGGEVRRPRPGEEAWRGL